MGLVARLFSWWANEPLGTSLFTRWKGELVGTDDFGNRYYQERNGARDDARGRPTRRWVLYNGEVEASKVPAEWHGWLRGTMTEAPNKTDRQKHAWEQAHVPNLTGTAEAWRPPGSLARGGRRPKATGDYEPWRPS